jgi:hypothetical protein
MHAMLGDIECFMITDVVYYSINDIDMQYCYDNLSDPINLSDSSVTPPINPDKYFIYHCKVHLLWTL